jgi:transcriptional regulator with XRE-family HTH domain
MKDHTAALAVRAKILGVLLKDARLAAGKIPKECADLLECSTSQYHAYELGDKSPSLPEVELLAYFFDVPLAHFWGQQVISEARDKRAADLPAGALTSLRNRIIGARLRQTRLAARLKLKDLAHELGLTAARLSAYEYGEKPIPLAELEAITTRLHLSIEDLFESSGPIGEWDSTRRAFERFQQLPPELREWITHPANETYLRLAQQLSQLPTDKLRGLATSLLEITY